MFEQSVVPMPHQAAEVRYVFDEERALAECRELISRRDEAKGEYKDAILELGKKFSEARRAWPGDMYRNGKERYSTRFLVFIEKSGLTIKTAKNYMIYARDPAKLAHRRYMGRHPRVLARRARILKEMLAAYDGGAAPEEIFTAIREELKEYDKAAQPA